MKTTLLPSYATLPFLTILSNVIPQDRDGPKETTTWWVLVAQRDLQEDLESYLATYHKSTLSLAQPYSNPNLHITLP